MAERESIPTKNLRLTDVRQHFGEVLAQVFHDQVRIVVEDSGNPVAAIISSADLERLNHYDELRLQRLRALEETSRAFEAVPLEELEEEVTTALAAVRARNPERQQQNARSA